MRVCPRCRSIYATEVERCGIDGDPVVEQDRDPLVGSQIDRYLFTERIGTGAMGVVYRVTHTELESDFALKVLYGEYASNKSVTARFRREAQAVSKMKHPNVIQVVDFGSTEHGLQFLVMESISGRTLSDILADEGRLAPIRAAWLTRQIASGLRAAHDLGFVHRDVKPDNIMLTGTPGRELVKILDFGIVGLAEGRMETRLTGDGRIVGTPRYMSPEQSRQSGVGPPADLYSLGVILYEMLAGEVPFPGEVMTDVLVQHSTVPPAPLPPSDGLEKLALWLLEKAPEKRPKSAQVVVDELGRLFPELVVTGEVNIPPELLSPASGSQPVLEIPEAASELSEAPARNEDEIPTERPSPSDMPEDEERSERVITDDVGTSAYALTTPPLHFGPAPFPQSSPSLEATPAPHLTPRTSGDLYNSAPDLIQPSVEPLAASPGSDVGPNASQSVFATYSGVSDHIGTPPQRRSRDGMRIVGGLAAVVVLGLLGYLLTRPSDTGSQDRSPSIQGSVERNADDRGPMAETSSSATSSIADAREDRAYGGSATSRRRHRRRHSPPAKASAPTAEQPAPNVSERELVLGHVLSQRGLTLADLQTLRDTRRLASKWHDLRNDKHTAEAAEVLDQLIEATQRAHITTSTLKKKIKRVEKQLLRLDASNRASPEVLGDLRSRLAVLRAAVLRPSTPKKREALAQQIAQLEVDIASAK